MTKTEKLAALAAEMAANEALPLTGSANLVFGEGDPDGGLVFIGEAPGQREDELCRPFVGRSGQLLDKTLAEIGIPRADVYITNIVKRRPPENRDPQPEEIAAYKPYLKRQLQILDPRVIITLGRFSMNYFLPQAKISRDHGQAIRLAGKLIMPMYHPAAGLRNPSVLAEFRADFAKLPKLLALITSEDEKDTVG